jgi:DNA polymerase III subunit delta
MISYEQFMRRIKRGEAAPAIVLKGKDSYLREMCRTKVIGAFVPEGAREWCVFRASARTKAWDEILQRAQMIPMMSPRQVLVVDDVDAIEKLGDDARDEITKAVASYLKSPAPFTVLVLEAENLDGRQKFTRLLNEEALMVELTIGPESAVAFVSDMAKDFGTQIEPEAAGLLADILNAEPARMHIELEKLSAYAQDTGRITTQDVEEVVVAARKNTVWQFADMIASRQPRVALAFLDNLLREGEQPAGIVGALASVYRHLIQATELRPGTNRYQLASMWRIPGGAAQRALDAARRIPKKDLLAGLAALAEADNALKSGNPDPRAVLEFLIAQLTPSASPATAARR